MIVRYSKFILEAQFRDNFISNSNDFDNYKNIQFIDDCKLIDYVVLEDNDKILKIKWNTYTGHDIINKIKNRTTIKSTSEWNEYFENVINDLFKNHFNEISKQYVKYNIYVKNGNYSIITNINYNNLFDIETKLKVLTITNGYNTDVDEIIEIDI
jgi:hypothetical protein